MGIMLGLRYLIEGAVAQAIKEFKQSIRHNPQSITAHYLLGLSELEAGSYAQAELELQNVLEVNPRYLRAMDKLVLCFIAQEKYIQALELFTKFSHANFSVSHEYYTRKIFKKIENLLFNRLQQAPFSAQIYNSLGIVSYLMRRNNQAQLFWRQSLKIDHNQPEIINILNRITLTETSKKNKGENTKCLEKQQDKKVN